MRRLIADAILFWCGRIRNVPVNPEWVVPEVFEDSRKHPEESAGFVSGRWRIQTSSMKVHQKILRILQGSWKDPSCVEGSQKILTTLQESWKDPSCVERSLRIFKNLERIQVGCRRILTNPQKSWNISSEMLQNPKNPAEPSKILKESQSNPEKFSRIPRNP